MFIGAFFLPQSQPIPWHTLVRTIATARVVMPGTIIRIAAGRQKLTEAEQALAFQAGANAIFTGDAMLTTPCGSLFGSDRGGVHC